MTDRQYTDQDVLTVEEAAAYLRVSTATVYKRVALAQTCSDRIPSISLGRRRVIVFWQLKAWLAEQGGMPAPAVLPVLKH